MDGEDYIKYLVERFVQKWEEPNSREQKMERKRKREPWVVRWFGLLLPIAFNIWLRERRKSRQDRQQETKPNPNQMPDYS